MESRMRGGVGITDETISGFTYGRAPGVFRSVLETMPFRPVDPWISVFDEPWPGQKAGAYAALLAVLSDYCPDDRRRSLHALVLGAPPSQMQTARSWSRHTNNGHSMPCRVGWTGLPLAATRDHGK
jgi:hypothetical protein